jgi:hypothetical protein
MRRSAKRWLACRDGREVEPARHGGNPVEVSEQLRGIAVVVKLWRAEGPGPFVVVHQERPMPIGEPLPPNLLQPDPPYNPERHRARRLGCLTAVVVVVGFPALVTAAVYRGPDRVRLGPISRLAHRHTRHLRRPAGVSTSSHVTRTSQLDPALSPPCSVRQRRSTNHQSACRNARR